MKKAILSFAFILMAYCGFSQASGFNYQAVVRNGSGALVPNGSTVGFRISIIDGSASGTVLYQETQNVLINNSQGLANLVIGKGTITVGVAAFDPITTNANNNKFLKIEVDPTGGTAYTDLGAVKIEAVPYAAFAYKASVADVAIEAESASNGFFTVFKTPALTAASSTITLSYTSAASTDILTITPNYNAAILPVSAVYWNPVTSRWQIYAASSGGTFPMGTTFNVMVVRP
jgi:hypothetical protein